jgi:hypothetical protein
MTSRQSPLNNPCQEEEAPTWPLQDLIEKVRTNKPTAAHKNVEWAMWQRPDDGTVVVQILSEVGQYEMSLIWAIEPEETEGGRWTAWTTRDVSGENVLYVTLEIGSAGDRATALERLQVLEDLQIIRVPKNE